MNTRGIHVVVVDILTHDIELAQVYDTHGLEMDTNNFYNTLSILHDQKMVIMAVQDEGAWQLTPPSRQLIESMGSKVIMGLRERQPWAFIGISGQADYVFEGTNEVGANNFAFARN